MSVEAIKAVWDHATGSVGQRLVLLALANRADEHGICWPGIEELMRKTCMSRSGVQGALRALAASGQLITLEDEQGGRGIQPLRWLKLPGLDGDKEGALRRRKKGSPRGLEKGSPRRSERAHLDDEKGSPRDTPYIEGTVKEPPVGNSSATSGRATSPIEQARSIYPGASPDERAALKAVVTVAQHKKAMRWRAEAVIDACRKWSNRNVKAEADSFAYYWTEGFGENRPMKDAAAAWRNWLKGAPTAKTRATGRRHPKDAERKARAARGLAAIQSIIEERESA